ncbi:50S ribosomal protein L10 [Candidatus Photodesmus anomalopis]|uniref:Large ribosomal subunit protein uL10 n=1 Tax=Candidatus Photodesmus katoptron Akat1 TaxID=1236703 RepID=S3DK38_9GAMM|nr:50S ribosomal protein L10 [Candidatus Photodesmus katoptron]EPE37514.1 ribosomal protein L10 [Candidatus Photodesmus katoptron Akat1]
MALNLKMKEKIVSEVNKAASNALSVVVVDSRGIKVREMTNLRKKARESGVHIKVVRNTLARRAVLGTSYECLISTFIGPTLIAFSNEHPGSAARLLKTFIKENKSLKIKSSAFEGAIANFDVLATLPTYNEAILRLMLCMKEASSGKLVRTMDAIRNKKEKEGVST